VAIKTTTVVCISTTFAGKTEHELLKSNGMKRWYSASWLLMALCLITSSCSQKKEKENGKSVSVVTTRVSLSPLNGSQTYSATIEEMAGTSLSLPLGGTMKTVAIEEGQMVRRGQLIAVADGTSQKNGYQMAVAATRQAQDALRQAQDAYQRMKLLHDNGSLPEIQWVDIQTKLSQAEGMVKQAKSAELIARKGLTDTQLFAPFDGYISQKSAEVGQNMLPGQPIAKLVKIDKVKVKMAVPESEIAGIHQGDRIVGTVAALGDRTFEGMVNEKAVSANVLSRSYEVTAVVDNPRHLLLPGMVCKATVGRKNGRTGIAVPADVVQIDEQNRTFVWVAVQGKARKTYINFLETVGNNIVVGSGLYEGDLLIVQGQQKVSNGTLVTTK
jgi:membrane fusion protein (multidrug efflux system)